MLYLADLKQPTVNCIGLDGTIDFMHTKFKVTGNLMNDNGKSTKMLRIDAFRLSTKSAQSFPLTKSSRFIFSVIFV